MKLQKTRRKTTLKKTGRSLSRRKDTLTAREVAYESGLGLTTIYEEIHRGRLLCAMVGNRHVVSRINYERWLEHLGRSNAA